MYILFQMNINNITKRKQIKGGIKYYIMLDNMDTFFSITYTRYVK